jgi:hypothetical protein
MNWKKILKIFTKEDYRQSSLDWWSSLNREEQLKIESDYFDSESTGETTDIDIEAMYRNICNLS